MTELDPGRLRRYPDLESPELQASDTADTLILDQAAPLHDRDVVVIGDDYGALTIGALADGAASVRVHQDSMLGELALHSNAAGRGGLVSLPLGEELVGGATTVLMRLPRSLDALEEIAALIAAVADPAVVVVAGGRIKHMSLGMNEVLRRHFGTLDVSLARQKSRVLIARSPLPSQVPQPRREFNEELALWVCATGAVFAGSRLDIGTRFLLSVLDQAAPDARTAIDLGCGSGILAAALARDRPELTVIASDLSAAAVASARATAEANGLAARMSVVRDVGLSSQPPSSADLVVLNPPFHVGSTVHPGLADRLFEEAARVLRPGGELWTVYNSHLGYRPVLRRLVGETREVARNAKFTVAMSRRSE
ncbi:MAG: rRNA (guanine1207-N2)-methyltransferase [Microbacteriaceae bacterium]|nr:rRNA (guanine1207-N2)-methyltransferase [Microbacteriaceae bacterium]